MKINSSKNQEGTGNLVHCDQTAYVYERNIGESVGLINDILNTQMKMTQKPFYSLQILRKLLT